MSLPSGGCQLYSHCLKSSFKSMKKVQTEMLAMNDSGTLLWKRVVLTEVQAIWRGSTDGSTFYFLSSTTKKTNLWELTVQLTIMYLRVWNKILTSNLPKTSEVQTLHSSLKGWRKLQWLGSITANQSILSLSQASSVRLKMQIQEPSGLWSVGSFKRMKSRNMMTTEN